MANKHGSFKFSPHYDQVVVNWARDMETEAHVRALYHNFAVKNGLCASSVLARALEVIRG